MKWTGFFKSAIYQWHNKQNKIKRALYQEKLSIKIFSKKKTLGLDEFWVSPNRQDIQEGNNSDTTETFS